MRPSRSPKAPTEADNLSAAAARLGCTVADLKRAKKAGCNGFSHGRVKIELVRKWLEENPSDGAGDSEEALKRRRLLAQCVGLEFRNETEKGRWILKSDVKTDALAAGNAVRGVLQQLVNNDLPSWAGLDSAALQAKGQEWMRENLEKLSTPGIYAK